MWLSTSITESDLVISINEDTIRVFLPLVSQLDWHHRVQHHDRTQTMSSPQISAARRLLPHTQTHSVAWYREAVVFISQCFFLQLLYRCHTHSLCLNNMPKLTDADNPIWMCSAPSLFSNVPAYRHIEMKWQRFGSGRLLTCPISLCCRRRNQEWEADWKQPQQSGDKARHLFFFHDIAQCLSADTNLVCLLDVLLLHSDHPQLCKRIKE